MPQRVRVCARVLAALCASVRAIFCVCVRACLRPGDRREDPPRWDYARAGGR